ncbi:MAG: hypothetical protein HY369_01870 [Candidatus Aenigmarchaeota archaeon]|nr:hypothetical protein [Candidatus Aenigmarchaeota archaeon]
MDDDSEKQESLLLDHFKAMTPEEKKGVRVYFSPKYSLYIFEHADGQMGIGSSLGNGRGFIYFHPRLGKLVTSQHFSMDNLISLLDRENVVKIGD